MCIRDSSEGLVSVSIEGKWRYVEPSGETTFTVPYFRAYPFSART